jgi:TonB family protein
MKKTFAASGAAFLLFLCTFTSAAQEQPLTIVEKMPEFTGGEKAKAEYFRKNIQYPKIEQEYGVQGVVYVTFIVEKDGSLSDVKVLRGIKSSPALNKEALRLVSGMPKWQAGMQNGKTVRVQYNMPVRFTLKNTKPPADEEMQKIAEGHYKKGLAFISKSQYKEALGEFDYTIFYLPGDANTLYQRGLALHNLKDDKSACDEWNKVKFAGSSQADEMLTKYCK